MVGDTVLVSVVVIGTFVRAVVVVDDLIVVVAVGVVRLLAVVLVAIEMFKFRVVLVVETRG